jgi:hypothetical protein
MKTLVELLQMAPHLGAHERLASLRLAQDVLSARAELGGGQATTASDVQVRGGPDAVFGGTSR